jgi:hypothetical protein
MNKLNEKLYGTTMKYNQKQEMLQLYDKIKSTQKINNLDELYNKVVFSNLDSKTVSMLQEMIELKVENIKLKNYNQVS